MNYADELREVTEKALLDSEEIREKIAEGKCVECKKATFKAAARGKYETTVYLHIYEYSDEMANRIVEMCIKRLKSCGLSVIGNTSSKSNSILREDGYVDYSVPIYISWYPESEKSND